MKKESRDRRTRMRRDLRLRNGTASQEDIYLDMLSSWNRAKHRQTHKWWETSKASLLMSDYEFSDYCFRDWVPQLIHNGRKP